VTVLIVSLIEEAPEQNILYVIQTNADLNIVKTTWYHNDELWVASSVYSIAGGEINVLILVIELPTNILTPELTFRVTPLIVSD